MREKDEQMQRLQAKEKGGHPISENDFKENDPLSQEDFKKDKEIRENTPDIGPFIDTADPNQVPTLDEDVKDPMSFQEFKQQELSNETTTEIENEISTNAMKNAASDIDDAEKVSSDFSEVAKFI